MQEIRILNNNKVNPLQSLRLEIDLKHPIHFKINLKRIIKFKQRNKIYKIQILQNIINKKQKNYKNKLKI